MASTTSLDSEAKVHEDFYYEDYVYEYGLEFAYGNLMLLSALFHVTALMLSAALADLFITTCSTTDDMKRYLFG